MEEKTRFLSSRLQRSHLKTPVARFGAAGRIGIFVAKSKTSDTSP